MSARDTDQHDRFWQAVLLQAVKDLHAPNHQDPANWRVAQLAKAEAEHFFDPYSSERQDFLDVCEMAGADHHLISTSYLSGDLARLAAMPEMSHVSIHMQMKG